MAYDVLIIGGGNAALCAAISAREAGAERVVLLEKAPKEWRGGNSCHTRNLRSMHQRPTSFLSDSYSVEEYYTDLLRVTDGDTNEKLAKIAITNSETCVDWMIEQGVRFQPSLGGTLHLGRTNAFFLGGGKALVNTYYKRLKELGVEVIYQARVYDVLLDENQKFIGVLADILGDKRQIDAKALVVAAGGFESNLKWLEEAWGPAARNFLIRGTRFNEGDLIKILQNRGAKILGDPAQGHAVAIDARSPKFDGGIVTRLDCISLGIVVNREGKRFYDEGEDFWPKRYAIWGHLVAKEPGQIAYVIIDQKVVGRFMSPVFPPIEGSTISELAQKIELDPEILEETVKTYNESVCEGEFNHSILDNCKTVGLNPNKSHWAQRLDSPPYIAYPLRPGITFTYLGVQVDSEARVYRDSGSPYENIFAAGEIMAGNILTKGYIAGIGMTIGTVFGRIAGKGAAEYATK